MEAGLLIYEDDPAGASVVCLKGKVLIGEQGKDNNSPRIIPIEFKSTHNLLVPSDMETIVTRCNQAVRETHDKKGQAAQKNKKAKASTGQGGQQSGEKEANNVERTVEWCNIARPLAQNLGYMTANHSRFGVLSLGTRTYFICVNNARVRSISNAWRVGKEHYLRAWFYFFKVAHAVDPLTDHDFEQWGKGTPTNSPDQSSKSEDPNNNNDDDDAGGQGSGKPKSNKKHKRDGASGANSDGPAGAHELSRTTFTTGPSPKIPEIDCQEFEILDLLGHGNHEVHLVLWKGQRIAGKSFDMFKYYKWFEK